jgi:site-specific recombinase XerD
VARPTPAGMTMLDLLPSWMLALDQAELSEGTKRSYSDTIRKTCAWLADHDMPTDIKQVQTEHLQAFLIDVKDRTSPGNAHKYMRNLRVFFNWAIKEKERPAPSPVDGLEQIKVSRKAPTVFTGDDLRKLIKVCSAEDDFEHRRDLAIIRILMDNGVRVSGLAGLRYTPDDEETNDVYLTRHVLRVRLKGGNAFWAPIGKKSAHALDRYIRARRSHPASDSEWLWLPVDTRTTRTGDHRFTATGIGQMIQRRGEQAGLGRVRPHKFRRTMATNWEGSDIDLMHIGGWESLKMVELYTRARSEGKAREAHRRLSPGDRI